MSDVTEARIITPRQGVIIDRYYKAIKTLRRLEGLSKAVEASYADDVIIRCEITAGDIRAIMACIYPNTAEERADFESQWTPDCQDCFDPEIDRLKRSNRSMSGHVADYADENKRLRSVLEQIANETDGEPWCLAKDALATASATLEEK